MGDTTGPSTAAQGAPSSDISLESSGSASDDGGSPKPVSQSVDPVVPPKTGGFLSRVIEALSPAEAEQEPQSQPSGDRPADARGMMNLRRMRRMTFCKCSRIRV